MAIQVIVRGKVPAEKIYDVHCEHCRSILRCQRVDLVFTDDGRNGTDISLIICPVCKHVQFLLNKLESYEVQSS